MDEYSWNLVTDHASPENESCCVAAVFVAMRQGI